MSDMIPRPVGANKIPPIRRTNAEKRKAVEAFLADEQWSKWSDREIAKHCGVSHSSVLRLRKLLGKNQEYSSKTRTYINKHGTVSKMRVSRIGQNQPRKEKPVDSRVTECLLKRADAIVRDNGREYAEALAASLKLYLVVTHENPEGSN
jgi:hypothetical protein